MDKNEIRRKFKKARNEMDLKLRNECKKRIHERLFAMDDFKECDMLFVYISFGSEVDTISIINKAFQMNKKVFVPKVEGKDMKFYEILNYDGLIRSDFGVLEPDSNKHIKFDPSKSDNYKKIMILPGLAFDKWGNRIGYGAGYYDRFLGRHNYKKWTKIALAYDLQLSSKITVDQYDIPVDYIITSKKTIVSML